jgi:hypothetical protein
MKASIATTPMPASKRVEKGVAERGKVFAEEGLLIFFKILVAYLFSFVTFRHS